MKSFGVIGAGTMGSGIAQKIALEGKPVTVVDLSESALARGKKLMDAIFSESIERKLFKENYVEKVHESITMSTEIEAVAEADIVIETVFEDREIKRELFARLEGVVRDDAVIASNTSSFSITELQRDLEMPERFIGLHFFYHPVKNRLLEIIPGEMTSADTLDSGKRLCRLLGKVNIVCKDTPGFVVNRFFVPWLNESVRLLAEGMASLGTIEATAKRGFRLGMGPFELMNVTGVAIAAHAAEGLQATLGDFYRPDSLLVLQAKEGHWDVPSDGEFSDEVFHSLLGVAWSVAASLVEEGCATPLDVDLGARVGLRWPVGPFGLFNRMESGERDEVLRKFESRYPDFPLPGRLSEGGGFALPSVTEEARNGVITLSLARPDRMNALNEALFADLEGALARNSGADVLILEGKGKNFAAGADIRFFVKNIEVGTLDRIVEFTRSAAGTLKKIDAHAGKVIAVVDGYALGGGAEMFLAADVIVATPRALIGFPETGIGIYPGLGGTYRLPRRVGKGIAKYLIGAGKMVGGSEAEEIGLVDYSRAPEEITTEWLECLEPVTRLEPTGRWQDIAEFFSHHSLDELLADEFAEEWQAKIQAKLKTKAPVALRLAMELIDAAEGSSDEEASANELSHLLDVFSTEDALAGLKSVGKHKPEFKGK